MGKTKLSTLSDSNSEKPKEAKKKPERVHIAGLKGGQRIKVVEVDQVGPADAEAVAGRQEEQAIKQPKQRGKKYLEARAKVDPKKTYSLTDATKLLKETSTSKFDGSVELHLVINKESVNTRIELPHSAGKTRKVEIASDETIEKLKTGKVDFDILLATPDTMPKLVPFAKLLGPRGLMPNPKNGTLVPDPKKALDQFGGNSVNIKSEKSAPLVHTVVAKVSQPENEIEENIKAVFKNVGEKNIKKAVVVSSMGPAIRLAI